VIAAPADLRLPVLVVDDDRDIRDVLSEVLGDAGYAVITARNGQEALDHLVVGGVRPAVILLDLMMPVMNGWEFRARQVTQPELIAIPVVAISADRDARKRADTLGLAAFIPKPLELAALIATIDRLAQ
jgi:CheY-like chemotaxis protein